MQCAAKSARERSYGNVTCASATLSVAAAIAEGLEVRPSKILETAGKES